VQTLLILLFWIFAGLALMVFVLQRFAKPTSESSTAKLSSWLIPLIGLLLLLRALDYYLSGG